MASNLASFSRSLPRFTILITLEVIINSPTVAGERSSRITHAKRRPRPRWIPHSLYQSVACVFFLPVFISRLSICRICIMPLASSKSVSKSESESQSECRTQIRIKSGSYTGRRVNPRTVNSTCNLQKGDIPLNILI